MCKALISFALFLKSGENIHFIEINKKEEYYYKCGYLKGGDTYENCFW